jgi:hypothetical protein
LRRSDGPLERVLVDRISKRNEGNIDIELKKYKGKAVWRTHGISRTLNKCGRVVHGVEGAVSSNVERSWGGESQGGDA